MNRIGGNSPLSPPLEGARQKPDVARDREKKQMREAAAGMESMFLNQMFKAMRDTVPEDSMSLENPATKIYRSMMDGEIADRTARSNSVGLADQIVAYLEARGYNNQKARPNDGAVQQSGLKPLGGRQVGTGGTHAGQLNRGEQRLEHPDGIVKEDE